MAFDPTERVALGRTGLAITRLGFGGASIGGLFTEVDEDTAVAVVRRAWDLGVRAFDTAPLYGYGASERRMGAALRDRPRDAFTLSTKVGRLVRDETAIPPDAEIDRQALDGRDDAYYVRERPVRLVFDYSADGVRRSIDESLERLGLDRIDIALIHDPDDHWPEAIDGAWPAIEQLRAEGVIGAVGAGMNQSAMLARFARETDMDVFLLAGRYTLLDQGALDELLPLCVERGIAVLVGGVMNSGVLADPRPGSRFDYAPASPEIQARARRLGEACARHDVPLRAAAMQFPLAHPAVASLVAGVRTAAHLDDYPAMLAYPIPAALWDDLRAEGLLAPGAPVPPAEQAPELPVIVDAHHHIWDPATADYPWLTDDLAVIRRRFTPDDLAPELAATGVEATVLVQTRSSQQETAGFLAQAAVTPFIRGVIGWVDLTDPAVSEAIAGLRAGPGGDRLVGIRHQAHDEPDPEWLLREDVARGIRAVGAAGLAYDLLLRPRELPAALELARRLPDIRFVIDHLAKPPIASGDLEPWRGLIARFAGLDHVACKVSGLVTEATWATWSVADLQPYVDHAIDVFGPARLLFGSDWPVCLLAATYAGVVEATLTAMSGLDVTEQAAVMGGNATRIYGL